MGSKIVSKNKTISARLSAEAERVVQRKPIADRSLLKMLISNEESALPSSAQVRMMALEILYSRGFIIFDQR